MLNLTRLHLGIAHESQFQGLGISPWHARLDFPSMVAKRKDGNAVRSDQSTLRADHQNRITL
jgi:hypothetical protein